MEFRMVKRPFQKQQGQTGDLLAPCAQYWGEGASCQTRAKGTAGDPPPQVIGLLSPAT